MQSLFESYVSRLNQNRTYVTAKQKELQNLQKKKPLISFDELSKKLTTHSSELENSNRSFKNISDLNEAIVSLDNKKKDIDLAFEDIYKQLKTYWLTCIIDFLKKIMAHICSIYSKMFGCNPARPTQTYPPREPQLFYSRASETCIVTSPSASVDGWRSTNPFEP